MKKRQTISHFSLLYQFGICALLLCLSSCNAWKKYRHGEILAQVGEEVLYESDLLPFTAYAASSEDSTRIAETYINDWVKEQTFYDRARKTIGKNEEIEERVNSYRRALYIHAYEEYLVETEMPKQVDEDSILIFYEAHPEQFILQENILKGALVVVPKDAPDLKMLQKWLMDVYVHDKKTDTDSIDADVLEKLEKYAYQNALGYELFIDQWTNAQHILIRMPMETNNLARLLKTQPLITMSDSLNTYYLRVTDKCLIGEKMPYDYARPNIEGLILERRKVEFLKAQ